MKQWIKYFLVGIAQTSKLAVDNLSKIIQPKQKNEELIHNHFGRR